MNQTIRMTAEEFRESPMYSGFQTGQAKRTSRPSQAHQQAKRTASNTTTAAGRY